MVKITKINIGWASNTAIWTFNSHLNFHVPELITSSSHKSTLKKGKTAQSCGAQAKPACQTVLSSHPNYRNKQFLPGCVSHSYLFQRSEKSCQLPFQPCTAFRTDRQGSVQVLQHHLCTRALPCLRSRGRSVSAGTILDKGVLLLSLLRSVSKQGYW